jgi:DNA-binding LacI/PurR family transcriptional regulator
MARPTIRDIARRAGVSAAVVSHVANDHPGHVSEATRRRVRAVIAALGYRPLGVAKSLRRRASRALGLVISDITSALFAPAARGVESVAAREGYQVLLVNAETVSAEREALSALAAHPVEGVVFMSTSARQDSRHLADAGTIPVAVINRYGVSPRLIRVLWDDRAGARLAVEHLIRLGHRRIGFIAGPGSGPNARLSAVRRLEGYRAAHRAAGLPVPARLVVPGDYSVAAGFEGALRVVRLVGRPTAILAANDTMAMGALRGVTQAGLHCPQEVAVVGIGDPPFMAFAAPPLTTVALPVEEAGRQAADRLLAQIRGERAESRPDVLPCRLIVRHSCGAAAEPGVGGLRGRALRRAAP